MPHVLTSNQSAKDLMSQLVFHIRWLATETIHNSVLVEPEFKFLFQLCDNASYKL